MDPIQKAVRKAVASGVATEVDFSSLEDGVLDSLVSDLVEGSLPEEAPTILKVARIIDSILALKESKVSGVDKRDG